MGLDEMMGSQGLGVRVPMLVSLSTLVAIIATSLLVSGVLLFMLGEGLDHNSASDGFGLGFRAQGLRFRVEGLSVGFRASGLGVDKGNENYGVQARMLANSI